MNSNISFHNEVPREGILSRDLYFLLGQIVVFVEIFFSLLGVATNIINIRVFVEQGVTKSSTTFSLLFLSIFDLFNCTLMIVSEVCVTFDFTKDRPNRVICGAFSTYAVFISVVFYYCSNWTTVYLSIERTLCVTIPLKVKLIMRPGVTRIVILSIFIFFLSAQMTYSGSTTLVWALDPVSNQTLPQVIETPFARKYLYFYNLVANTILSSVAILIVATTTIIMIHKLNTFRKWRQSNVGATQSDDDTSSGKKNMSSKDVEMVKSVTTVTCIFLVCLSAGHIPATVILVLPGASFSGINRNVFYLGYQLRFMFSLINSSINFFFYIKISTRYKEAFASAFGNFLTVSSQKNAK